MNDFKNYEINESTWELANCTLSLTEDPAGDENAFNVQAGKKAGKKIKHAVRFHTHQESIWIRRTEESKKDVDLLVSWGRNKEQKFKAGDAWTPIDLGKSPRQDIPWIVEIELRAEDSCYIWPFS